MSLKKLLKSMRLLHTVFEIHIQAAEHEVPVRLKFVPKHSHSLSLSLEVFTENCGFMYASKYFPFASARLL